MEHNVIDIPQDHYIQPKLDPQVNMTVSSWNLDSLQTYLETVSSQQQLNNEIICLQTLS